MSKYCGHTLCFILLFPFHTWEIVPIFKKESKIKRHYYITLSNLKRPELKTRWSPARFTVLIIPGCPLELLTPADSGKISYLSPCI